MVDNNIASSFTQGTATLRGNYLRGFADSNNELRSSSSDGQRFLFRVSSKHLKMGAKLDTPARVRGPVCPLCHCECKNPTVLKCRHRFCEECIGELWSGSLSGPVFCPECKQEYRKLTDAFWDMETSFPSASRYPSGMYMIFVLNKGKHI